MKWSDKRHIYQRFLNKELGEAELEHFFLMVERGDFDHDYQQLMPELTGTAVETTAAPQPDRARPLLHLLLRISIAAALALGCGYGFIAYRNATQIRLQSTYTTITVPVGTLKVLTLADRSVITLTSGAVFKYPAAFSPTARKVFLISGRGFFQVAKDRTRPFTVYTEKLSTTVLGTSFTVENYRAYHAEKVKLFTGKVKIGSRDHSFAAVELSPGQQYAQNNSYSGKSIFASGSNVPSHTEDGSLAFEDTGMAEALIQISSYYNVNIKFSMPELQKYAISGRFTNEPLEDVLHTLLFTHHLKFKKIPEGYIVMK